ncbi:hypothetical protein GCM10007385_46790 [Tateyamaria omphalii]|uniref:TrbG/VirB9 family P-type conjugative transfer protein n=1 Tax=Tateyamaria omphalii TaxID=299262 RepID=UPI001676271B|nr:TrbG/VirB9 family P-type conjugative transfer protein [Tateyamaria omphalii]GGX72623.1 hypothetical protein GCM10007385_46790 [Tateyamaria omphalii]
MKQLLKSIALCALMASPALAEKVPPGSRLDARVRVTPYVDGEVFVLRTGLTRATTVEFERGERIVSIVAGDTEGFNFESVPGDRVFAVKPTARSVRSNVTVYTNRRSYYFSIREGANPFYVLRFAYQERAARQAGGTVNRQVNNRAYGVNERNDITPTRIWDDGAFTYFQFAKNAPVPAVFRVTGNRERSVNSSALENRIVRVSGTSQQWALRLGDTEVCIVEIIQ